MLKFSNILFRYFFLSFFFILRSVTHVCEILAKCEHERHYNVLTFHAQVCFSNILFLYFFLSFFLIHRSATNLWKILAKWYHEIHYKFLTLHSQVFKILLTVKFGNLYMVSWIFYFFISCYHSFLFFEVRQTYGKSLTNGTMKYRISF